jgi:hypothetical protein
MKSNIELAITFLPLCALVAILPSDTKPSRAGIKPFMSPARPLGMRSDCQKRAESARIKLNDCGNIYLLAVTELHGPLDD